MESISHHVTPLVINSFGADTDTHTYRRPHRKKLRNQALAGLQPAHTWFKISLSITNFKGNWNSLLGRNWLEEIKLDWNEVAKTNGISKAPYKEKLDNLLKQYDEIFRSELDQCKYIKVKLHVKLEAVPKFYQPRLQHPFSIFNIIYEGLRVQYLNY